MKCTGSILNWHVSHGKYWEASVTVCCHFSLPLQTCKFSSPIRKRKGIEKMSVNMSKDRGNWCASFHFIKESYLCVCLCTCLSVCLSVAVYHCKCIDTWLVQDSDLCPLCKKSVIEDDSDQEPASAAAAGGPSGSDSAEASNVPSSRPDDDDDDQEDAPLLHAASRRRPRHYRSRRGNTSSKKLLPLWFMILQSDICSFGFSMLFLFST